MKKILTLFFSTLISSFLFSQTCPTMVDIDGSGRILFHYADQAAKDATYDALESTAAVTLTGGVIGSTTLATPIVLDRGSPGIVRGGTNPFFRTSLAYAASEPNNTPFVGTVVLNFQDPTVDLTCDFVGPLPVELVRFNVEKQAETALLSWTTASEDNNDYFQIERSNDGRNFEKIGKINGEGNSTAFADYSFIDENPEDGLNYYRLNQVDFDGTENMSEVQVVEISKRGTITTDLTVYPTLAEENITVDLTGYDETELNTKIISVSGSLVRSFTLNSGTESTVNVADLMSGLYLIRVQSKKGIAMGKFIVK